LRLPSLPALPWPPPPRPPPRPWPRGWWGRGGPDRLRGPLRSRLGGPRGGGGDASACPCAGVVVVHVCCGAGVGMWVVIWGRGQALVFGCGVGQWVDRGGSACLVRAQHLARGGQCCQGGGVSVRVSLPSAAAGAGVHYRRLEPQCGVDVCAGRNGVGRWGSPNCHWPTGDASREGHGEAGSSQGVGCR